MANVRQRGTKWQAQVRRLGHPPQTRTFVRKCDAEAWARAIESDIDIGVPLADPRVLRSITMHSLLMRYEHEVSPRKKGAESEIYRLKALNKTSLAQLTLDKLTTSVIAAHRDRRLREVSSSSVRREMTILRHVIEIARMEWGIAMPTNPVALVRRPPDATHRDRRLTSTELEKLAKGLATARNKYFAAAVWMAIATGMRRSEILKVLWQDIDTDNCVLRLHDTKNGMPRTVPLGPMALEVLQKLPRARPEDHVFPISANAIRLSWERLKRRIGVDGLRFHDLRHEAISRFFEAGLSVPEVSLISGHKDPRMLARYTHLRPDLLAKKLAQLMPGT